MVWVWKNVIIGVGALMTGVFLWTTAWVAWLIHFSGVPFSDPRVQQFREDPVGMMAEPLISGYVETVLLLIPLLLAGFAVGVVLRTAWDRFHSRAGGDADGN